MIHLTDKRLTDLINATADDIEREGQPKTKAEERAYFLRYENLWTAVVERQQRAHG